MGHVQPRAVVIAADELDGADDFFRKRIIEQEGIRLDGLVREAAAARFFPGEMLVYDGDPEGPPPTTAISATVKTSPPSVLSARGRGTAQVRGKTSRE